MKKRKILGWALLVGSIVGWPITALTIFSSEPQGILGLSWLSLIITSLFIVIEV